VSDRIEVIPLAAAGEIEAGADLAALVLAAAPPLRDGDVVVVAHKAVSKSEGRVVELATVIPSAGALELSAGGGDPRMAELVLRESRRIVRRRGGLLIAETHHGLVCASAGIDRSNGPHAGWAVLLPVDPDASAARLRAELEGRAGVRLAVVVADTMGRALRRGIVGTAIGASGLHALRSYAGAVDPAGYELRTTAVAVADELASAADLVLGKLERVPAALIRGFDARGDGSGRDLIRDPAEDLFR
jgi:coenzyme F420-0:L-glutamate ligase / coenzyme F420-1:gamma-L-glutamate ligase